MKPSEVPDQLIVTAREAYNTAPQKRNGQPTRMRYLLAAVWPEIERQVRAKVAAEIAARRCYADPDLCDHCECRREDAALIRGETR